MIMSPTRLHTDTYALSTTIAKQHSTPLLFTHHTTHLPNTSYTFTSIIHTHPLMKYRCKNNEGSLLLGSSSPNSRKKKKGSGVCRGGSRWRSTLSPTLFTVLILKVASPQVRHAGSAWLTRRATSESTLPPSIRVRSTQEAQRYVND